MAWGHEPPGKAMPGGERLVLDVGGQQELSSLLPREAADVAGRRAEQEATPSVPYPDPLQHLLHCHPAPAL